MLGWAIVGGGITGVLAGVCIAGILLFMQQPVHNYVAAKQQPHEVIIRPAITAKSSVAYKRKSRKTSPSSRSEDSQDSCNCEQRSPVVTYRSQVTLSHRTDIEESLSKIQEQLEDQRLNVLTAQLQLLEKIGQRIANKIAATKNAIVVKMHWLTGYAHWKIYEALLNERSPTDAFVLRDRLNHIEQGLRACDNALELDEHCVFAHKCSAILVAVNISDYEQLANAQPPPPELSMKLQCQMSNRFYRHLEKALRVTPNDLHINYMLAKFFYGWAALSWTMRSAAFCMGAKIPEEATFKGAYETALKCDDILSGFHTGTNFYNALVWKQNKCLLAQCNWQMSNYHEAKKWLLEIAANEDQYCGRFFNSKMVRRNDYINQEIKLLRNKLGMA